MNYFVSFRNRVVMEAQADAESIRVNILHYISFSLVESLNS